MQIFSAKVFPILRSISEKFSLKKYTAARYKRGVGGWKNSFVTVSIRPHDLFLLKFHPKKVDGKQIFENNAIHTGNRIQ